MSHARVAPQLLEESDEIDGPDEFSNNLVTTTDELSVETAKLIPYEPASTSPKFFGNASENKPINRLEVTETYDEQSQQTVYNV